MQGVSETIYARSRDRIYRWADRMFAWLLGLQWLFGIALAFWASPFAWSGANRSLHVHVWFAIVVGGLIAALPIGLACLCPGQAKTRQTIAVAQMLFSALFIHLTGGRIETHFHVFGSLAFLSFYRDWRVIAMASFVTVVNHLMLGIIWPESMYGVPSGAEWRWLEHAGWVVFIDVFLLFSCKMQLKEMRYAASRQATLEDMNENVERRVQERTRELHASEEKFRSLANGAAVGIFQAEADGKFVYVNECLAELVGVSQNKILGESLFAVLHADDRSNLTRMLENLPVEGGSLAIEVRLRRTEAPELYVLLSLSYVANPAL